MKRTFFIFLIIGMVLVLISGCLDGGDKKEGDKSPQSPSLTPKADDKQMVQSHLNKSNRENIIKNISSGKRNLTENKSGWRPSEGNRSGGRPFGDEEADLPQRPWKGGEFNPENIPAQIRERLGLPENASEEEIREAMQRMREEGGFPGGRRNFQDQ